MSRRINGTPDKAAQNAAVIKGLLKLDGNKSCADCKKTKHPRWASWNLGVFVCIRCSGIHRGMGTHISRVKSVDLDAWTDEQLASVVRWGNVRANRYWEAKLADGHVPSDSKMENFIRTKYEAKRWTMEGPMPDPSTLTDDADQEMQPPAVGHERTAQPSHAPKQPLSHSTMHRQRPHPVDLFGDDEGSRSSSASMPKPHAAPPKQMPGPGSRQPPKQDNSLLDILGSSSAAAAVPDRPSSAISALSQGPSRGDLKNSILSLYASTPRSQSQSQPPQARGTSVREPSGSSQDAFQDAFSGLSFGQTASKPVTAPSAAMGMPDFAAFSQPTKSTPLPPKMSSSATSAFPNEWANSGPVFDKPLPAQRQASIDDWGDFDSAPPPAVPVKPAPKPSSAMAELFDAPAPSPLSPPIAAVMAKPTPPSRNMNPPPIDASVFQLSNASSTRPDSNSISKPAIPKTSAGGNYNAWASSDNAWTDNAWATPDPTPDPPPALPPVRSDTLTDSTPGFGGGSAAALPPAPQSPVRTSYTQGPALGRVPTNDDFGGWASAPPKSGSDPIANAMQMPDSLSIDAVQQVRSKPIVSKDEDFGGWVTGPTPDMSRPMGAGAAAATKPAAAPAPAAGGFGGDDLFNNVWG